MSAGGVGQGAVYSPLPQSVVDSDTSEEELHSSNLHPVNNVTNRKPVVSPRYSLNKFNGQKMGDYRQLDYEREADTSMNGIGTMHQNQTTRDDVRIIKPDEDAAARRRTPMGPVRTFFFAVSIFLCFFTVIVFLWILPCDWAVCPELSHKPGIKQWDRILNRLELKGSISVVPGLDGRGRNLIMMGRCKIVDAADTEDRGMECTNSHTDGGLISLVGSNGAVAWWKPLRGLPREMDCSLIDVDSNGVDDCIVVGAKGLLAVIDPISGILMWNLHSPDDSLGLIHQLEFPTVLPDLDGDGVNELITSCSIANDSQIYLILVSGKTGQVMGQPFKIPDCVKVHGLNVNKNLNVSYVCQSKRGQESLKLVSFKELFSTMILNQSSMSVKNWKTQFERIKQHKSLIRVKQVNGAVKTYSYVVNGRSLILENRGRCPLHCSVTVKVIDKRPGFNNEMVWNYTGENMYAMVPATLLFNNRTLSNGTVLTEPISGFVLKFWQWNYVLREDMKAESATSSKPPLRQTMRNNVRYYRSVLPTLKHSPETSVHHLKERVILITFNATDMHIVNASQNEVVQLCVRDDKEEIVCQPDLEFQEQSLLIADLDQDSSQELVSYYTTYVNVKSGPNDTLGTWRLESKVRVIRLEAELPKLYEAVSQQ